MLITEFNNEEIADESEMSDLLSHKFQDFCESIEEDEGMTRPPNEDDGYTEGASFMWTDKACRLIDAELNRLHTISGKYFPGSFEINIESGYYREY